jgi:hypothetical protein
MSSTAHGQNPTLHEPIDDPLGYDTSDPSWMIQMARNAQSGVHRDAIKREVDAALRRWGMNPNPPQSEPQAISEPE